MGLMISESIKRGRGPLAGERCQMRPLLVGLVVVATMELVWQRTTLEKNHQKVKNLRLIGEAMTSLDTLDNLNNVTITLCF